MSYIETIRIGTRDCDMFGRWKPSAMMEAMQEVAIAHCEAERLGRSVTDGLGVAWILSRCRVELSRLPANGESLSVETFALPTRHLFFPRGHVFLDSRGEIIGGAHGLWLLMDIRQRRAVANPFVSQRLPIEDREPPAAMPATVHLPGETPVEGMLVPQFTDFDLNGHVNNAKYLDWCWNALGAEALRDRALVSFDVNYDGEIMPGEAVCTRLYRQDDGFTFCGLTDEKRRFGISGKLASLT